MTEKALRNSHFPSMAHGSPQYNAIAVSHSGQPANAAMCTYRYSFGKIMQDQTKPKISTEEMMRRREALRRADAHNRIEGIFPSPECQPIYEAFVRGEIEFDEIMPRVKAILHKV